MRLSLTKNCFEQNFAFSINLNYEIKQAAKRAGEPMFGCIDTMTRQEFIKNRDKQRKTGIVSSLAMLVCLFAPVVFMAWLEPRRSELPEHAWTISNVAAITVMVVGILSSFIIQMRLTKRLGFNCPECKKSVFGMSALVIATGRCGHCGARVLDDAD